MSLTDHVVFEVECDRPDVPATCRCPRLQYAGRAACGYSTRQPGLPIASTALMDPMTKAFVAAIHRFARDQRVPWVDFAKGQRKDDVMHEYLAAVHRRARGCCSSGRAQEKTARVPHQKRRRDDRGEPTRGSCAPPRWSTTSTSTAVDADFGPFFLKFCTYFPYTAKLCINGNEWAKRQAAKAGIGFTAAGQRVRRRRRPCRGAGDLRRPRTRADRRAAAQVAGRSCRTRSPPADQAAGYRYDLSILQAEFSLTQMLDRPVSGRIFFEQVHPRQPRHRPPRPGQPDLRPAHHPQRPQAPHPGPVPHPGDHRRGHPEPARRLQAHQDQAVPQGRTSAADRDHDQRHPRLRDRRNG